eukprot:EST47482.1 Kinase, PLK [Spironucleus salmonicida]
MSLQGAPAIIQDAFHRKNYKTNNVLGKGGFAVVYHVTDMYSQENFACKLTQKSRLTKKKFFEKFTSEIKIHRQLIHPYIARVNNVFKDTLNYYMLMELCNGGTLSDIVRRRQKGLTEEEVQRITYEICQAYQYMKQHKIIHRDMKSSNVFLSILPCPEIDPGAERPPQCLQCKIGDFGLSVQLEADDEMHYTLCGTPNFLPPETIVSHVFRRLKINRECDMNIDAECQEICKQLVYKLQGNVGKPDYNAIESGHSYPSDMWSLGCIVYSLLYLRPPFESNNIQNTYRKIVRGEYQVNSKINPNVSNFAIDFISKLLVTDPNERMTIEQAMQHEWLQDGAAVKLKAYPLQCRDADFNAERWNTREMLKFCQYEEPIPVRIQQLKEGKIVYQKPQQQQVTQEITNKETRVETVENMNKGINIEDLLIKKFTSFFLLSFTIKLPNPIEFPPVMQYLDLLPDELNMNKLVEFRNNYPTDIQSIVFNEYDLWLKCMSASPSFNQCRDAFQIHNHTFTLSWIDFSNRYGFAYQLSNGCVGVLFNDMSIIVLSGNLKYIDYIDVFNFENYQRNAVQIQNKEEMQLTNDRQQVILRIKFQHAKEFISEKKYKLIMYFKEYLENRSIQPIVSEKRETSDYFISKYFDYFYDESSRVYGKNVTPDQINDGYKKRQQYINEYLTDEPLQLNLPNLPYAIKMMTCTTQKDAVQKIVTDYVSNVQKVCNVKTNPFTVKQMSEILVGKVVNLLTFPQLYIKRYHLNEQSGTLCILYNSKVFQVNYPDHIKIIIAHKTVSILSNRRELLVYPSTYLKQANFRFDELRTRIGEARRLYELVRRTRD